MVSNMKTEDFIKFAFPSTPEISPDGSIAIFPIKLINEEKNSYKSALYKKDLNQAGYEQITEGTFLNYNPKFSPDGKLVAFLSSRTGSSQLYALKLSGGEAIKVTNFPNSIIDFCWNNSGTGFLFVSEVTYEELEEIYNKKQKKSFIIEPEEFHADNAKKKMRKDLRVDPRVITEGHYREGNKYLDGKFKQPFIVDLIFPGISQIEENLEKPKPIHVGEFGWHYLIGNFSKDNSFVYVSRIKDPAVDRKVQLLKISVTDKNNYDILLVHADSIYELQISPNGKNLIFEGIRLDSEHSTFDNHHIFLYSLDHKQDISECLTKDYPRSASQSRWLNDTTVIFLCNRDGKTLIEQMDITTRKITTLLDQDQKINYFSVSKNGSSLAYEASHISNPTDIFSLDLKTKVVSRITNTNKYFKNEQQLAILKTFTFIRENIDFQGWLLLPHDYESKKSLPLVVEIHGGPAVMWSPHEKTMWFEFQMLVARGYAVYFTNPRGSDGYGIAFRKAVYRNWGNVAGNDILAGLDVVLRDYQIFDPKKIFVTGGSYGGYMTGWLITHVDRFKAAASQRGVYDFTAFAQTTDIPLWFESNYSYELIDSERNDLFERDSPTYHVKNLNCPLLIIHSDNDFRVPVVSAEQFFWLAKRYGKTVELVRYPREGHELSRSGEPRHIIDRINRIIGWFDKFNS